jgi:ClpP class serine protease
VRPQAHRYDKRGLLAIDPQAFLEVFFSRPEAIENVEIGDVTVVDIRGPLDQHASSWCDSYEAIERRVTEACEGPCKAIVMRFDSPGGDAAGCFETARSLRVLCEAADKPLYAFVQNKAGSAAYALACAAQHIAIGDTALVGSIGIIESRPDFSAANAARGLRVALITSGARKADGHPDAPITEAELQARQKIIDSMAGVFFEHVAEMRGLDAKEVADLDARIFHGEDAIRAGLVDEVTTFDALLAAIAANGDPMKPKAQTKSEDKTPYESARAALEEAAKGDDANAAAAKRALAAMDEGDKPKDEDKPKEGDDKPKGEGDEDAPKDEDKPKDDDAKAAMRIALEAKAEVHKMKADAAAKVESDERERLIASRPDFDDAHKALLQKASMEDVRQAVKDLPVLKTKPKPAATAAITATRGEGQGGSEPTAGEGAFDMDAAMGLTEYTLGVKRERNSLVFGAMPKPKQKPAAAGATEGAAK